MCLRKTGHLYVLTTLVQAATPQDLAASPNFFLTRQPSRPHRSVGFWVRRVAEAGCVRLRSGITVDSFNSIPGCCRWGGPSRAGRGVGRTSSAGFVSVGGVA